MSTLITAFATEAEAAAGTAKQKCLDPARLRSGLNAAGSAPVYACRAWVNFNGTGTPAINASGNVSSITDNGVGDYTVNFLSAMQDGSYAVACSCMLDNAPTSADHVIANPVRRAGAYGVSGVRVGAAIGATNYDPATLTVVVFR